MNTEINANTHSNAETLPFHKNFDFSGKLAFVAGGTSGINLGIAQALAEAGANIVVAGRNPDRARQAQEQLREAANSSVQAFSCDVRDFNAVHSLMGNITEQLGAIDFVISGAAGNFLSPAVGLSANAFKTVIDIDLIGTFNVFRASYEFLRLGESSLIAITAPQAEVPMQNQAHACAAKAGVNMLTQCLAMEWGEAGVRVNAISPGFVEGTLGASKIAPSGDQGKAFTQSIALKRLAKSREIAEMACFLCSPAAAYITGSIFRVDGGVTLGDASQSCLQPLKRSEG